jgi:prepilin-type processing-associated H-X9-DG protein
MIWGVRPRQQPARATMPKPPESSENPAVVNYASPGIAPDKQALEQRRLAHSVLLTGLLAFTPFLGFFTSIVAIIDAIRARRAGLQRGHPLMPLVAVGLACAIAGSLFWGAAAIIIPSGGHARPQAQIVKCASNLRQIGLALMQYAESHDGHLPDDMGELVSEDLATEVFVCPNTSDERADIGPTTQQTIANVASPGHLSYIYLGKGKTNAESSDTVLAYEPIGHHPPASGVTGGSNVLFGDGHVSFMPTPVMKQMIQQLNAGLNPPPPTK